MDVAETKNLQADAGPTTLTGSASGAHELSPTPEPIAGPSGASTKALGRQQPEKFDVKTPGRQQPEKFDVKTPARQQSETFDVDEFLVFLDDYSEAGFNKAPGCPQPEREDFDVDEFVALLNDYGKAAQIARFMGPTWGPPGDDRTQVGPMLAPWTLLSGRALLVFMTLQSVLNVSMA